MSADFWILVIFAFFFGVLIGWLLQRRTAFKTQRREADAGPPANLGAVEAEIKNAKLLLDANHADATIAAETLAGLEDAITRANERLKLIIKAVKSAKLSD